MKIILALLVLKCHIFLYDFVEVSTKYGKILGSPVTTRGGRTVYGFKRIPYAQPPTGDLRFKAPVPVEPWSNVLNATKDGPNCPQAKNGKFAGEENCLFLNIYTPRGQGNQVPCTRSTADCDIHTGSTKNLPVLFFIHGGRWEVGTSDSATYGPEFLLDNDIVFVSINYRVGIIGFLSTGDEVASGNWGMKDQALALKWVHENIEDFGGDPNRVTIMGESKGGAAVNAHFYAPSTQGLFKQGVSVSGVFRNTYSFAPLVNITTPSKEVAKMVDCPTKSSLKMLECMRKIKVEKLVELQSKVYPSDIIPPNIITLWGPVIEPKTAPNPYLTFDPVKSDFRPRYPWFNLVNGADGASYVAFIFGAGPEFEMLLKENPRLVLPILLQLDIEFCRKDIPTLIDRIINLYFGDRPVGRDTELPLVQLFSDYFYFTGAFNASISYDDGSNDGRAYFYNHTDPQSVTFNSRRGDGSVKETPTHTDILLNLFADHADFPNRTYTPKDVEVSKKIIDLFISFTEDGAPAGIPKVRSIQSAMDYKTIHFSQDDPFFYRRLRFWSDQRAEFQTKSLTNYELC